MNFVKTLQNGHRTMNVENHLRDWNYWAYVRHEFDIYKWKEFVVKDLKLYRQHKRYGELEILTHLALEEASKCMRGYRDPAEFNELIEDIKEVGQR